MTVEPRGPYWLPQMPAYFGIDAAHRRDCTAFVAVGYHRLLGLVLLDHAIWRPTEDEMVIPEDTAQPRAVRLSRALNCRAIRYDPAHFETAGRTMRREVPHSVRVEPFDQVGDKLITMGQQLYDVINFARLTVYDATDLREHVLNAQAKSVPQGGFRIVRGTNDELKIDGAIALALAVTAAQEYGPRDCKKSGGIR